MEVLCAVRYCQFCSTSKNSTAIVALNKQIYLTTRHDARPRRGLLGNSLEYISDCTGHTSPHYFMFSLDCKITLCSGFMITVVTLITHTFMIVLLVSVQLSLRSWLMITLVTSIPHSYMFDCLWIVRLLFCGRFMVTLVTSKPHTFMLVLFVFLQNTFCSGFMVTQITLIFHIFILICFCIRWLSLLAW